MAQVLVVLGASIFLILGVFHGILTLQDLRDYRTFTPTIDSRTLWTSKR